MRLRDRIIEELRGTETPFDDDRLAARLGVARQQVNQVARALESAGVLSRTRAPDGKIENRLASNGIVALPESAPPAQAPALAPLHPAVAAVVNAAEGLSKRRPIFHAEADFQHALAWELQPVAQRIRLELRPLPDEMMFLDMLVHGPYGRVAVELKYLTTAYRTEIDGEVFALREHSALDHRRYDAVKDIQRLERFVDANVADHGVAVVLTNAAPFWKPALAAERCDRDFRIHDGAELRGRLDWAPETGPGTRKNREAALELRGAYGLQWRDYAVAGPGPGGRFRMLVVPVGPAVPAT